MDNKLIDRQYIPFFLEYSLMSEYQLLIKQNLNGIYVLPSARNPLVWFGIIFIRQGLYQGGIFKFCVIIPSSYPNGDCPQVFFEQAPFHPLISMKTGQLDVKRAFPKWKKDVHRICNVLSYARRIFFKIDTQSPLNESAGLLYKTKLLSFKAEVMKSIENSKQHLNDPPITNDPYELVFNLKENLHEEHKKEMIKQSNFQPSTDIRGLSWVDKAKILPFSKDQQ